MDTITQGLLGAVTAHLGFRQKIGRDAGWAGVLAATVPDLDIFLGPIMSAFGAGQPGIFSHGYHRGITHSLLFAPILALPLAFLWLWLRRSSAKRQAQQLVAIGEDNPAGIADQKAPSFWLLYACILVAVITHPLLDVFTSYGTQIFAPFSNYRYAFDSIGIVDLIYTSILIVTLVACYFVARRKWRSAARATVIIGWCGFLLSSGYIAAGRMLHDYAISRAMPLAAGQRVESIGAFPAVGSIFLWRVVIKTDHQWIVARVHVFSDAAGQLQSTRTDRQDIGSDEHDKMLIERANELPEVQYYKWFSNGLTRIGWSRRDGETIVEFQDMRYGYPLQSQSSFWPMRVIFGKDGNLLGVFEPPRHAAGRSRAEMIDNSWRDMWNP